MGEKPTFIDGRISAVEKVARHRKRVAVYVEQVFVMELDADLAAERGVRKDSDLSAQRARELWHEDQRRTAIARALHFLSYRSRTIDEVRRKLNGKGYDEEIIDATIDRLRTLGYVDDHAFAGQFVRARLQNKSHGPRRIRSDLRRLGVSDKEVDISLGSAGADDIRDAAIRAGRKYWRRLRAERDDRKRRWRFVQYLMRRGFGYDDAHAAYEAVSGDATHEE